MPGLRRSIRYALAMSPWKVPRHMTSLLPKHGRPCFLEMLMLQLLYVKQAEISLGGILDKLEYGRVSCEGASGSLSTPHTQPQPKHL